MILIESWAGRSMLTSNYSVRHAARVDAFGSDSTFAVTLFVQRERDVREEQTAQSDQEERSHFQIHTKSSDLKLNFLVPTNHQSPKWTTPRKVTKRGTKTKKTILLSSAPGERWPPENQFLVYLSTTRTPSFQFESFKLFPNFFQSSKKLTEKVLRQERDAAEKFDVCTLIEFKVNQIL